MIQKKERERIERFIDNKIRPVLRRDGGDIEIDCLQDGVLYIVFQGHCSGCPHMQATLKNFVEKEITAAFSSVHSVEQNTYVNPELNAFAKQLLKHSIVDTPHN